MKKTGKCPKCGGTEVIARALAIDGLGQSLSVATFHKPDAVVFKQAQRTTVSAWVCAGCGYVEFYASDPSGIQLPKA
jgi:predicted nucleic-acid-binding Zn-ribbon protein